MTKRAHAVRRIRLITGIILGLSLVLLIRLYNVQVLDHEVYVERATKQYVHTVRDLFDRGSIYFTNRDGSWVSAATIKSGYVLAVDPSSITDAAALYDKLQPHLTVDRDLFIDRATLPDRTYVEIEATIEQEVATKIEALKLPGIYLYRNQWRYYPGGTLAARTVGFTGHAETDGQETGRYGLERYYDEVLTRRNDQLEVNFFAEIFSNLGTLISSATSTPTGDVVTTIEPTVARMLQQTLEEAQTTWNSELTGGIIINPQTGSIYALDAVPTFDGNDRKDATIEMFQNPLVESVYEMGSIIKPLTMAAGLDSGAVSPSTTYYDSGTLTMDTFTIGNYDGRGRGTVDMQEVLNQSLNTGVAFVVQTMGKERFRDYFLNLKIGSETGIDLPNEAHGLIENLNSPRDIEYATASFGQGIAMTPIETVRALAALANGGVLITPHLSDKIVYEDGTEKKIIYPEGDRVFSEETSENISRMLVTVVDDALQGGTVKLDRYSVAAKTGTAQIANQQGGGYYKDRYLHSFFGYFPAYDPEFLIFLYTVEPKGVSYASETLTKPFMDLTSFLINYYSVPPDR